MSRTSRDVELTRECLIKAAIAVFSTDGYVGAATREIAKVAGVSEVTLFRHFQNKERLLSAVAQHITAIWMEAFIPQNEWTYNLSDDLLNYAKLHDDILEEYEALFRMFIGEAHRHPADALQVLQESFLPLRERLILYLQTGVERGFVCSDILLPMAVDQFTGMLLSGMIRRHVIPVDRGYNHQEYVQGCVDLFVRGITTFDSLLSHISFSGRILSSNPL